MSLNSVQQYVKSLLDGLQSPQLPDAQAFVAPPATAVVDTPLIYIWGGKHTRARLTLNRPHGFMKTAYEMEIWLIWASASDAENVETEFPVFINAVIAALHAVTLPVMLTDSVTHEISWIESIGDTYTVDQGHPTSDVVQGYLWQFTLVTAHIEEALVG